MKKKNSVLLAKQKGAVTVLVALTLPVLVGAAALAVDLAYLHVVRNELQNDADAAALAGARALYKKSVASADWTAAAETARSAITLNRAAGSTMKSGLVKTGYWSLAEGSSGFQALPVTPTGSDAPAVQVQVTKSGNQNGGAVRIFFSGIWGIFFSPVSATAVAGVTSPGSVNPTGLFPMAMSACMYQKYWNLNSQPPSPIIPSNQLEPPQFKISSVIQGDSCESGQWTKLNFVPSNASQDKDVGGGGGASLIKDIIEHAPTLLNPPPAPLSIGDAIYMESGAETSIYNAVKKCIGAATNACDLVVVPVISRVVPGSFATIQGFACLRILDSVGGKPKDGQRYITVQMSNECAAPSGNGAGPNYGVVSPPSLFK